MMKKLLTLVLVLSMVLSMGLVAFAAEKGEPLPNEPKTEAILGIDKVTGAEALAQIKDGVAKEGVVLIDLRAATDYEKNHIKGTVNLPVCLADYSVNTTLRDAFVKYVKENVKATDEIYLICYMGTFCVNYATDWLTNTEYGCGLSYDKLHRVAENKGVWNDPDLDAACAYTNPTYLEKLGENDIIVDVRSNNAFLGGFVDGSIHVPVFADKEGGGYTVTTGTDDLAKSFTAYVKANKEFLTGKNIFLLCNSGASGAKAATKLLTEAGIAKTGMNKNVFTIEGGAKAVNPSEKCVKVTGKETVEAIGKVAIVDVRSAANYGKGHLKGAISMPLFDDNGVTNGYDALAQNFLKAVKANAEALKGKEIHIVCNSGARGAQAATKLLMQAGYSNNVIRTIEGGAKGTATDMSVPNNNVFVPNTYAYAAVKAEGFVIIDVRTVEKYTAGHLAGSLSMPLFNAAGVTSGDDQLAKEFSAAVKANAAKLEGKEILIVCNSGSRGAEAATKLLAAAGYTNVKTIEGGAMGMDTTAMEPGLWVEGAPEVNKPETDKPETDKPETDKPETDKPETDTSDKEEDKDETAPETGDSTFVVGYAWMMLAAVAAVVVSKKRLAK